MAAIAAAAPSLRVCTGKAALPARAQRGQRLVVRASAKQNVEEAVIKGTALAGLAASFFAAGNAQAAMEVANIAASDNRLGLIAGLALPVLGWVGFNILGPAQNQLAAMGEKTSVAPSKPTKKRSVAAGLGLGAATLLAAQNAEAAQQVADLAASDNRLGVIAGLAVPVLGWVLFNILGPAQNQLAAMSEKTAVAPSKGTKKRSVAAGLGLGAATLLAAQNAEAAQQVADLAASDNRFGIIAGLALPALGWVLFNILGPAQNQLAAMSEKTAVAPSKGTKKRSVAAGLGLGAATLLAAQNAEAAQQVADLAASDNRFGIIAGLALPALGWVLFNILGPAQNQLAAMSEKTSVAPSKPTKKRSVAAGLGLGAATLLAAQNAEAAQQVADLAASDNRFGIIAGLALPALGWVLFNILGPAQNQLAAMSEKTAVAPSKGGKRK